MAMNFTKLDVHIDHPLNVFLCHVLLKIDYGHWQLMIVYINGIIFTLHGLQAKCSPPFYLYLTWNIFSFFDMIFVSLISFIGDKDTTLPSHPIPFHPWVHSHFTHSCT